MNEIMRILLLLLKKNSQVRKKYWIRTFIVQLLIPIGIFLIAQTVRLITDNSARYVNNITYYPIQSKQEILNAFYVTDAYILRFTPQTSATIDLMKYTRMCLGRTINLTGAADEETMVKDLTGDQVGDFRVESLGIVFETIADDLRPTYFKYKIRTKGMIKKDLYDPEENGDIAKEFMGPPSIIPVQLCLDEAYINWVSTNSSEPQNYKPVISIQQMPYPPYTKVDRGTAIGGQIFTEIIKFIFMIILCIEIAYPANEKYIGVNILMSVSGVSTKMNLSSWFLSAAIFSICYIAPIVLIMRHFMPPQVVPFLTYGDPIVVWLVLFFNLCHMVSLGYHLSSYFWKPSNGIFATFMFLAILNNVANFASSAAVQHFLLYIGLICPSILFQRMFEEITIYESKLVGAHWSNMFSVGSMDAPTEGSIGMMLIFSIIGIFFNFYMAVIIQVVHPGKYGVSKNPFSCFQSQKNIRNDEGEIDFEEENSVGKEFEKIPKGTFEPRIRIRGLKKTYTTGVFKSSRIDALKGVSMDFYKSQITVLLGHNGAGKTTMMSILSGLTSSTEGVILLDGKNIQQHPESIKNNIGLCPQENMVFPELTLNQQLLFFGTLKARNKTKRELESEIDILLNKVNLIEKRNFTPKQLSGGQKRRLCLAMAAIGDGNVLILDEPTSGIDAESKREVWDIVLKMRGEKTIIISTHDMEEADILGDRIAIMHTGRLKSYGTSMFLKKLYGDGQVEVTLSVEPWCQWSKIIQTIKIPAQLVNRDEGKMVLAIPQVESLPEALDFLESSQKDLDITGMSVSMITLEQVFLRVTRDETDAVETREQIACSKKITSLEYFRQCFIAFLIKKVTSIRKSLWPFWFSLMLPCFACTVMLAAFGGRAAKETPISLTLRSYNSPAAFVKSSDVDLGSMYAKSISQFGGSAEIIRGDYPMSVTSALLKVANEDIGKYRNEYIISAELNKTGPNITAHGFYSGTAYLGIPITLNALSNAILKTVANNESYKIETLVQQLPSSWAIQQREIVDGWMITVAIIVYVAPAIGLHVTQPLEEARSGIKQLQNMTGASKFAYWASMFLFDYVQYIISSLLLLTTFILVDLSLKTKFYGEIEILVFMGLMLLFGLSMLPFVYSVSFLKRTLNATMIFQSVTPSVLGLIEMVLGIVETSWDNSIFKEFRGVQSKIFQLIPFLSFMYGHSTFFTIVSKNARCRRMTNEFIAVSCIIGDTCCGRECYNGDCKNPFPYFDDNLMKSSPSLSTNMMYLVGSFFLFCAIIFVIEQRIVQWVIMKTVRNKSHETNTVGIDELVLKEKATVADAIRRRINGISDDVNENVFSVYDLRKRYGNLEVVKGISFRVKEGECFGLLGVNGAGKSTTFRMLTGEEVPNNGQIWLRNFNIESNRIKYLQEMGYCPQQNAIIETLNAWDHLYLFARLRGVPGDQVHDVVKKWIEKLNLTACAAQPSSTYSGGNKRRLNIAMALIGNPSLVLMDEPTTGMDPAARRSLWNTLKVCQDSGQSIILTSHSMEECEVLCNRLVIMVKGQLVCVGASQELKQRFGAGYNIHVKLSPNRSYADVETIKRRIESHLMCKLIDENSGFLGYHVTDQKATWTIMYGLLNELKNDYSCIEDFAILSSTLEQLFIQFARARNDQENGTEDIVRHF